MSVCIPGEDGAVDGSSDAPSRHTRRTTQAAAAAQPGPSGSLLPSSDPLPALSGGNGVGNAIVPFPAAERQRGDAHSKSSSSGSYRKYLKVSMYIPSTSPHSTAPSVINIEVKLIGAGEWD